MAKRHRGRKNQERPIQLAGRKSISSAGPRLAAMRHDFFGEPVDVLDIVFLAVRRDGNDPTRLPVT